MAHRNKTFSFLPGASNEEKAHHFLDRPTERAAHHQRSAAAADFSNLGRLREDACLAVGIRRHSLRVRPLLRAHFRRPSLSRAPGQGGGWRSKRKNPGNQAHKWKRSTEKNERRSITLSLCRGSQYKREDGETSELHHSEHSLLSWSKYRHALSGESDKPPPTACFRPARIGGMVADDACLFLRPVAQRSMDFAA